MGKIFDALEKANRQTMKKETSLPEKSKRKGNVPSNNSNVVSFAELKNPMQEPQLCRNLVAYHNPQSIEAELFKVLRTNLLFPANGKAPKTIMVTSAISGDGKSLVSANLAISIANGIEQHVLLIDADIRKPSIHTYFGLGRREGLSEYLASGSDVSKNFVKTPVHKLTILPAGTPPDNPSELLTTQKMKTLLSEVAQRYEDRYIIIDTAPPSVATETAAIANYVDGIIIVVRAGKTHREAVSEVIDQLGKEKIFGLVLNNSDQSVKKYYGYGKSYYKPKPISK
jgi:protein-tyrosine kinase